MSSTIDWAHGPNGQQWFNLTANAFVLAENGAFDEAFKSYQNADILGGEALQGLTFQHCAPLAMLRHRAGEGEYVKELRAIGARVRALPPDEDILIGVNLGTEDSIEAADAQGMAPPVIDRALMRRGIRSFISHFDPGYHMTNITGIEQLPHAQILSTGRAGTMSIFRLLERSHYMAYHGYLINIAPYITHEQALRISTDNVDYGPAQFWMKTRAAEWLGAAINGRPWATCMHYDLPFAPAIGALHLNSKFLYVHRDPVKVFESFYSKGQWSENQVQPRWWSFEDGYHWRGAGWDEPTSIAWYIAWTESFCEAMLDVYEHRAARVSADGLFARDNEAILTLKNFLELSLSPEEISEHFRLPINAKRHRVVRTPEQVDEAREAFIHAYRVFGGRL